MSIFKKIFGKKVWEELADDELDAGAALSAAWDVPAVRSVVGETVIDSIGLDDSSMPEELRGCQVVERRFSDGTTGVFYIGDGICADESQASVLIELHRQTAMKTSSPPRSSRSGMGGFSAAPSAQWVRASQVVQAGPVHADGPRGAASAVGVSGTAGGARGVQTPGASFSPGPAPSFPGSDWGAGGDREPVTSAGAASSVPVSGATGGTAGDRQSAGPDFDVLDELPDDETVPRALRAALVVRRSDGVYYLTKDARFVPKAEAEEWLDLWERAHSPAPASAQKRPVVEPEELSDVRFAETTPRRPHPVISADAFGSDSSPGVSPEVTPRVLESPILDGNSRKGQPPPRLPPRMELDGRPVVKGWGFRDEGAEQDPWQRALEQAGLTEERHQPFGGDLAEDLATIPRARPEDIDPSAVSGEGEVSSSGRQGGRRQETPTDKLPPQSLSPDRQPPKPGEMGPAFRKVLRIAEGMRQDALAGRWAVAVEEVAEEVVREVCEQAIAKPWSDDRIERMVADSVAGHQALVGAGGLDRSLRRELESGSKVVIVANPARVADLNMSLVATLARLRAVGAKRAVVVRDLARLFEKVTCSDLSNYLMTKSFIEEFSFRLSEDHEAAVGKTVKVSGLRRLIGELLSTRAGISLNDVVEQVERRHVVTLDFLNPVLMESLEPLFRSVSDELVARLKGKPRRS